MHRLPEISEGIEDELSEICARFRRLFELAPEDLHLPLKAALELCWFEGAEWGFSQGVEKAPYI